MIDGDLATRPNNRYFDLIQDGSFWVCLRMGNGSKRPSQPRNCYTYPTIIKLGNVIPHLRKNEKAYGKLCSKSLDFC